MPIDYEDNTPRGATWEWKIPAILLALGLMGIIALGFEFAGPTGVRYLVTLVGLVLVVYVPLTIAVMYLVAYILGVSYGVLYTAILKMTGLIVFTLAIRMAGDTYGYPLVAWIADIVVTLMMFSYAFELELVDTIWSVILISLLRFLLWYYLLALMLAAWAGISQD